MKRFVSILLVLAMVMALAPMTALAAEEKTTISVVAAEYGNNTAGWWADFETLYERQNPTVDLVVDVCSWNDIYDVVYTRVAAGQAPDILNMDTYEDFCASGQLLPVKSYMSDSTYAKFYPDLLNQSKKNGTVWAVPDLTSTRALYYNKDILSSVGASVPTNWGEVYATSAKIKEAYLDSVIPWAMDVSSNEAHTTFGLYTWNMVDGGYTDANGNWALNSDANLEIMQQMTNMYLEGLSNGTELNRFDIQDLFANGEVAMTIAPDSLRFMLDGADNGFNYGIAPIPATNTQSTSIGVMDRMMCFDNHQSAEELAAITAFFDLFYDDEVYVGWTSMEGFLPATSTGAALLAEKDPSQAAWAETLSNMNFLPAYKAEWWDVRTGIADVFVESFAGGDPIQLLDALQAKVTGGSVEQPEEPDQPGVTEITLWTYPIGGWGDPEQMERLIAGFEEYYPDIKVNVEYLDYMSGDDKVNAAIEAGATPDLIIEGPERIVKAWGEHMVTMDILEYDDMEEIYPAALNVSYCMGRLVMYPLTGLVHTMAINKTVFEAAGAMQYINEDTHTWKSSGDFLKAVQAVYEYTGHTVGTVYCAGQGGDQGTRALVTNLFGGTFTNETMTRYTWDSREMIRALQELYDCEGITFDDGLVGGDEISMFRNGDLSMAFCWNIAQQSMGGNTNSGDEIMVMAFPSNADPQLQGGIWGLGIFDSGNDARIEAANTFVQYMCESEATADAIRTAGYFPLRSSVEGADLSNIWEGNEVYQEYDKLTQYMGPYYQVASNWGDARYAWWNMLQEISFGNDITETVNKWNAYANGGQAEEPDQSDKTTIEVLAPYYGDKSEEWWQDFEIMYENKYPDVNLVLEICSWNDIYGIMDSRIRNGNIPDILEIDGFGEYANEGMLLSAEDYLTDATYSKFGQGYMSDQLKQYGSVWAIPDLTSVRVLYYNKEILNAVGADVPTNWDEVVAVSEKIKAAYGDSVIPWGLDMTDDAYNTFSLYTWNMDGDLLDNNGQWNLNSSKNVSSLSLVQQMQANGLTNGTDISRGGIEDRFANGEVAMTIAPEGFAWALEGLDFGTAAIPSSGCESSTAAIMDYMMCFNKDQSEEEMVAIQNFFDLFYDDGVHLDWTQMEGFMPATVTAADLAAQDDPFYEAVASALAGIRSLPRNKDGWDVFYGEAGTVFDRIVNGEDVRTVLDEFQAAVSGIPVEPGDMDGDGVVDDSDVARLLWYTLFSDAYEIKGDADFNHDGAVDDADVAYLLWYTLFPELYPI